MDWYFGERMVTNIAGEKVKKERNDEIFRQKSAHTRLLTMIMKMRGDKCHPGRGKGGKYPFTKQCRQKGC